ncbi:MAG TPA: pantoate--beta-alanine ligase [Cyclobacteriaceae bacterium]|nr:pantoate--beta-alanine ligase [Cyclobacteriaceae bacterium]
METGPLQAYVGQQKQKGSSVGLVPTMGALHAGHLSLVQASREANTVTVCSIFVNPAQFNNPADLEKYPRTLDDDLRLLRDAGCDVAFCPQVPTMYGQPSQLSIGFGHLDKILEGEFRPGHFSGVGLVVAKLFNIVQPDTAYFGQKDFQQFKVISKLVEELKFNVKLVCMPIVREPDGLAMSSRNKRLDAQGRQVATVLYACLIKTREGLLGGESFMILKKKAEDACSELGVKLEYLAIARREDLSLIPEIEAPGECILLIAAFVGDIRLIDNIFV